MLNKGSTIKQVSLATRVNRNRVSVFLRILLHIHSFLRHSCIFKCWSFIPLPYSCHSNRFLLNIFPLGAPLAKLSLSNPWWPRLLRGTGIAWQTICRQQPTSLGTHHFFGCWWCLTTRLYSPYRFSIALIVSTAVSSLEISYCCTTVSVSFSLKIHGLHFFQASLNFHIDLLLASLYSGLQISMPGLCRYSAGLYLPHSYHIFFYSQLACHYLLYFCSMWHNYPLLPSVQ